ncbi:hypothetical protein BAE44_0013308, partial [Dichanthelium oligosanthes]
LDFLRKNAQQQEVVNSFEVLTAEGAGTRAGKAMAEEMFRGPAPTLDCQPKEKAKLVRSLHFPKFFGPQHGRLPDKVSLVS